MSGSISISADSITVAVLQPIAEGVRHHSAQAEIFNDLPDIPWRLREEMRAIQGMLDKVDERILELLGRIDTPDSQQAMDEIYGPLDYED